MECVVVLLIAAIASAALVTFSSIERVNELESAIKEWRVFERRANKKIAHLEKQNKELRDIISKLENPGP